MKTFHFLELLSELDESYIIDTMQSHERNRKVHIRKRNFAIAACFALLLIVGSFYVNMMSDRLNPDLPILVIHEEHSDGMGFQAYNAYEIDELVTQNPWKESTRIRTLPVFKNHATFQNGMMSGASREEKEEKLFEIAKLFKISEENLVIKESEFEESALFFENDNMVVSVGFDLMVTISYDPIQTIPEYLNFSSYSHRSELIQIAKYLQEMYPFLFEKKDLVVNITGGYYDFLMNQLYELSFFEQEESMEEQLINYNFRKMMFIGSETNGIWMIRFENTDLSEKTGDYPIKSLREAKKELNKGKYFTTVPYEMPGLKYVEKVELIYKNISLEEYLMPYYRFYIELPEEERENGMKCFGIYDVPAIESKNYKIK